MFTDWLIACEHLRSKKTDLSPSHCSFFYHYVQLQLQVEVRRFGSVWGLRPIRPFPQTFILVFLPLIPLPHKTWKKCAPHICVYIFFLQSRLSEVSFSKYGTPKHILKSLKYRTVHIVILVRYLSSYWCMFYVF